MATFNREVGIAFGNQTTEGTADGTIAALAGSLGLTDGIIRGDVASGLAESGVEHSFTKRAREKGSVTGSFTELASEFLEEEIELTFAFPFAGPRSNTTTPVDTDFDFDKGIRDLLLCVGLVGATSATPGWRYTPADVDIATAKIFDSGLAWVVRDIRGNWELTQTPGEIGIMTCTLSGIVDSFSAVALPTFNYGVQDTINAPAVQGVSPLWSFARGWTDLTISCENNLESILDSAADTGRTFEQTGRVITVDMTIRDDDVNKDYSREQLVLSTAPVDDLTYQVGASAGAGVPAIAYAVSLNNLDVQSYQPDVAGRKAASTISAKCTGLTDGSEMYIENR